MPPETKEVTMGKGVVGQDWVPERTRQGGKRAPPAQRPGGINWWGPELLVGFRDPAAQGTAWVLRRGVSR